MIFILEGTNILVKNGKITLGYVYNNPIHVWSDGEWVEVVVTESTTIHEYYRILFGDGSAINLIGDSSIPVKHRFQKEFMSVNVKDLYHNVHNYKYAISVPRTTMNKVSGINENLSYDYGFILGDGCIPHNRVEAGLFKNDKKLKFTSSQYIKEYKNINNVSFDSIFFKVDVEFSKRLKYANGLPHEVFNWDRESVLKFIAGWADADGCNASKGIRIYGRKDKLSDGQLLLSSIGIPSSLNLMSKKGTKTNLGERKNDVWYLQITKTDEIPSQRLNCNNSQGSVLKGKSQTIRSINLIKSPLKLYTFNKNTEKVMIENVIIN